MRPPSFQSHIHTSKRWAKKLPTVSLGGIKDPDFHEWREASGTALVMEE